MLHESQNIDYKDSSRDGDYSAQEIAVKARLNWLKEMGDT